MKYKMKENQNTEYKHGKHKTGFRARKNTGTFEKRAHGYLKFNILKLISINYNTKNFIMRREEIGKLMTVILNFRNISASEDTKSII